MSEVKRYRIHNEDGKFSAVEDPAGYWCKHDALAAQRDEGLAREAELQEKHEEMMLSGFYQKVTDEDLRKIADFVGDGDLPKQSFFMRPDAAYLANVSMHMVREVQAMRQRLAEAEKLLREQDGLLRGGSMAARNEYTRAKVYEASGKVDAFLASPGCSDGEKAE